MILNFYLCHNLHTLDMTDEHVDFNAKDHDLGNGTM